MYILNADNAIKMTLKDLREFPPFEKREEKI